jgi:translation elongation factor EF-4
VYWKRGNNKSNVFDYWTCRIDIWYATSWDCFWFYDRLKTVSKGYASLIILQ